MVIVPCSMKTLAGVAHGLSRSLIERAADVMLKERRRLVLVPRETPMSLPELRNMVACAEAGAMILPAMPAFYQQPSTIDDLAAFRGREDSQRARVRTAPVSGLEGRVTTAATRASLSKEPERIARMFDAIARRYDRLNHLLSAGLDRRWRRRAIRELKLTGRERVLDVCTGTADLAIEAATSRERPRARRHRRRFLVRDAAAGSPQDSGGVAGVARSHRARRRDSVAAAATGRSTSRPSRSASATSSIPFRPAASFIVCSCLAGDSRFSSSARRDPGHSDDVSLVLQVPAAPGGPGDLEAFRRLQLPAGVGHGLSGRRGLRRPPPVRRIRRRA